MKNFRELIFCIGTVWVACTLMAWVASSSIGFTQENLAQATTGLRALMMTMMDYKAAACVGILGGLLLFGLSKLFRMELVKTFFDKS